MLACETWKLCRRVGRKGIGHRESVAETPSLEIARNTWRNANIQFWLKYSVQKKEE